jgi:hypothetical protein
MSGMVNVTLEWCKSAHAAAFLAVDKGWVQKRHGQPWAGTGSGIKRMIWYTGRCNDEAKRIKRTL